MGKSYSQKAFARFNMENWGNGYFDISQDGFVTVSPDQRRDLPPIYLSEVCDAIREKNLNFPILIRFMDILKDRIDTLKNAFNQAMDEHDYPANYHCVYPIKTNQQRHVLDEIINHGAQSIGLETGSKPELLAVLGLKQQAPMLIICNGYKDREYIRLALIGQQMGHQVFIIIEKISELNLVLDEANNMNIQPKLGVRIRLASIGKGRWQNTGGEKAKFGLLASQVLQLVNQLQKNNQLDLLQLIHFHMGSQIANIRDIQKGLQECARYYAELNELGAYIEYIDVGGGLSVDYQGTQSRSTYSMNYSVDEYARKIIHAITEICVQQDLPYPNIVTESGRALTAHHAVLVTNVIDKEEYEQSPELSEPTIDTPTVIADLWQTYVAINTKNAVECFHDVCHFISEAYSLFNHGLLSLQQRAWAEQIYQAACHVIKKLLDPKVHEHQIMIAELNEKLADKYFCNFSIFQSIPDVWAIQQIFPILPLSQLNEPLTQRVTIQDLTCDSDGRIDNYIDGQGLSKTLPMPAVPDDGLCLVGFFLVGAYQEILGDMHNLFGDTHSINVYRDEEILFRLEEAELGDEVCDVLQYVHIATEGLLSSYQIQLGQTQLTENLKTQYLEELQLGLSGYTYLED